MFKLCIDPGHGGEDPGAVSKTGLKEADITLKMSLKLKSLLTHKDLAVKLTRETNKYVSLQERCNISNAFGADLFVSIHCNAGGGYGGEIFNYTGLKEKFNVEYESQFKSNFPNEPWRGIKKSPEFYVINGTICLAYLIETLFIDMEYDLLNQDAIQTKFAVIMKNCIYEYFNLKDMPVPKPYDVKNEVAWLAKNATTLIKDNKLNDAIDFLDWKSKEIISHL